MCTCDPTPTLDAAATRAGAVARSPLVRIAAIRHAGEQAGDAA